MKNYLVTTLITFLLTVIIGIVIIPILRRVKAGQPILKYVEIHKEKGGTPTMGGLFFIITACVVYFVFNGFENSSANVSVSICLAFMIVGFVDDFLKIKFKHNEGLKPYQKIIFQLSIASIASYYAYTNGMTSFFLPFTNKTVDLGMGTIILVVVIFIAVTNSVNLTDGLDGLAATSGVSYLIFLSFIVFLQSKITNEVYLGGQSSQSFISLSTCFIGALLGFLIFNVNKAKVFMGDTGSLGLGGIIASLSIFTANSLIIPVLGFVFVFSSLSVIIQVAYFKKTKKRVFLMAPFHHHLQLKGLSEAKISFYYSMITCIIGALLVISYL